MPTHAVNKQVFDFTCSSESVAGAIRHEFLHFTSVELNRLLNKVLTEHDPGFENIFIDRLEIDLGELQLKDFGNSDMLSDFASLLSEKIAARQQKNSTPLSSASGPAESDSQEILESLFLRGDLPWWLDKTVVTDPNTLLTAISNNDPLAIRRFVDRHQHNPVFLMRLNSQRSLAIKAMFTEFCGVELTTKLALFRRPNEPVTLYSVQDLISRLTTKTFSDSVTRVPLTSSKVKQRLIRKLLRSERFERLTELTSISFFADGTALKILNLFEDRKQFGVTEENSLRELLMQLSPVEIKFINWFLNNDTFHSSIEKKDKEFSDKARLHLMKANNQLSDAGQETGKAYEALSNEASGFSNLQSTPTNPAIIKEERAAAEKTSKVVAETDLQHLTHLNSEDNAPQKQITETAAGQANNPEEPTTLTALSADVLPITGTNQNSAILASYPTDFVLPIVQHVLNNSRVDRTSNFVKSASGQQPFADYATHSETMGKVPTIRDHVWPVEIGSRPLRPTKASWLEPRKKAASNSTGALSQKTAKLAAAVMKRLNRTNQHLFEYLLQLPSAMQTQIKKILKTHQEESKTKRKLVETILNSAQLPELRLLQSLIMETLPASNQSDAFSENSNNSWAEIMPLLQKLRTAQNDLKMVPAKFSNKDVFILQDVFAKVEIHTESERSLVRRLLLRLEMDTVQLLLALASQPENEFADRTISNFNSKSADSFNSFQPTAEANDNQEKIYIANAGLCLLAPYLNGLFNNLAYLEKGIFKNKATQTRAIYLLQYIATGKSAAPEFLLQLNKLLCAAEPEEHSGISIRLTKKEKTEADQLIGSVIENWKSLKNTSVQGFRESFLQRRGIISETESSWTLQVEKMGHDLLLDTIPWGFKLIKLAWMKKMLQVEW